MSLHDLVEMQKRRATLPPEPGEMTADQLMRKTPDQVAAYFVPDIVRCSAGCTSRIFWSDQPHKQVVLAELLHRLLAELQELRGAKKKK